MNIGFKEWAIVCKALGEGSQRVIVRKGGIAEGRQGFRFEHPEFFLFPTLFHEQIAKTRLPSDTPVPAAEPGLVRIDLLARVEWTRLLTDWEAVRRIAPFHILSEKLVRERFDYGGSPGVNIAFVRVFRLDEPRILEDRPAFGGCRSWVDLPGPSAGIGRSPIVDDEEHRRAGAEILSATGDA